MAGESPPRPLDRGATFRQLHCRVGLSPSGGTASGPGIHLPRPLPLTIPCSGPRSYHGPDHPSWRQAQAGSSRSPDRPGRACDQFDSSPLCCSPIPCCSRPCVVARSRCVHSRGRPASPCRLASSRKDRVPSVAIGNSDNAGSPARPGNHTVGKRLPSVGEARPPRPGFQVPARGCPRGTRVA